jgi:murein DD-endopeptidase MepM/ murein hydrolase activator NlpD
MLYYTQAGDTLPVVAVRFGVLPDEITSPDPLPARSLLPPNQLLIIPRTPANTTASHRLMPDSEVVYSPSATDFDVSAFVREAGGYLSRYQEYLKTTGTTSGADIVHRVAIENSINPRLLLALLEYQSGWVYGEPENLAQKEYPMGHIDLDAHGLYQQLVWAVRNLSVGYYGWREGLLTDIEFPDGVTARLAPDLNSGTVALQYYFAQLYDTQTWVSALDMTQGFPALYKRMHGDPWLRALTFEPLYPPGLTQPDLILPFMIGQVWSFSGGPHGAWEQDGARAALDFAPASMESGCVKSDAWVVAAASGLIVRSGHGIVVLDLDGDGYEQTGWALLYLHLTSNGNTPVGRWVEKGDLLGHPSCEGGTATGTHIHIARKYNGEWFAADGPIPFNLGGWIAHAGKNPYEGNLTKDGEVIYASVYGAFESRIRRNADGP